MSTRYREVDAPDVSVLVWLMEVTEPELWHYGPLPGEDLEETVARIEAGRDIADELLREVAAEHGQGDEYDPAPVAAQVVGGWAA
jgi:hypothetical protein